MYTEEFDELSEERPQRTYVSGVPQQDANRLLRENERLKKTLEKEKFFNKLLDQELKEAKNEQSGPGYDPYWYKYRRGSVSSGTFYSLLVICLAMATFIGYTLYYNVQYNLFPHQPAIMEAPSVSPPSAEETTVPPASSGQDAATPRPEDNVNAQAKQNATPMAPIKETPKKPVTDSVPNIVSSQKIPPKAKEPVVVTPTTKQKEEVIPVESEAITEPVEEAIAPVVDTRPVLAYFKVISKANFYNAPDENTMRSAYIAQSNDKIIGALNEKNGFIYVEYKNDRGFISKGWLSLKDLKKAE